jgi:Ca2+-binding RTX toxin-like protein
MATFNEQLYISAMYVAGYDRAPDLDGFNYWQAQIPDPATPAAKLAFSDSFVSNHVFGDLYDGLSNNAFVQAIYKNVLGQGADGPGQLFWTTYLATHSRAEFLTAFVEAALFVDVNSTNYPGLTPAQLEVAQQRQDFLTNKANVGIYFATTLGTDSNVSVPPSDPNVAQDPAYIAAQDILNGVTNDPATAIAANDLIDDAKATADPAQYIIDNAPDGPFIPGVALDYTTAIDHLVGTAGDDSFTGSIGDPITGDTLQSGDTAVGNGGDDVVNVAIYGSGAVLTGLNTTGIETISVKALTTANEGSTLDLSGTKGVTTLESFETDGAQLTFRDIQTVDTAISIIDTDETHNFTYDTNAYHADPSQNVVDLTLQELHDAEINFGDKDGVLGQSQVTQIDIHSVVRPGTPVSPAFDNVVSDLNVGDLLKTVNIDGNPDAINANHDGADLKIVAPLDQNISLVDAHNLDANLWLDMSESNEEEVDEVIYEGAQGDDHINFGDTSNDKQVRLSTGDDWVVTGTGEASVEGGAGDDKIWTGGQNDLVFAGSGDDFVHDAGSANQEGDPRYWLGGNKFDLGTGDDELIVDGAGNNTVIAGDGFDDVSINGNGNNNINLGAQDDILKIVGDGNDSVIAGTGDDSVTIIGDAVVLDHTRAHYIDLGAGDDTLTIEGGVIIEDSRDRNAVTTIIGGDGNDTVVIDSIDPEINTNHVLNADLGTGDDSITLRADDLRNNDTVTGGSGIDTMVLTNHQGYTESGLVRDSETQRTTSFEKFDLRDQGITLSLTDNLIDSADGNPGAGDDNSITVITELANGTQTVDTTALTVPTFLNNNFFNLQGGDYQDIVVADEESINSFNTLRFDNPNNGIPDATDDTLRVVNGAQLTYGDLYKVSGLEHIELTADSASPQTWVVELDNHIINQTTDFADLVISVDPKVREHSKLYIEVDPTLLEQANSNVRILRNGNVDVYVNGNLVTEPEYDNHDHPYQYQDFHSIYGNYGLYVQTELQFTTNSDHLVGTDDDDTFTADSVDDVQAADSALGYDGFDTVSLNFAVANENETLYDQLDYVELDSIERIEFNTGNNVLMDGIDYEDANNAWFAPDLQQLATGQGDDYLTNMRQGVSYDLGVGDDFISLDDRYIDGQSHSLFISTTVDGGLGIDTVEGTVGEDQRGGSDSISISNVEFVYDYSINDADHVDILTTGSQAADGLITFNNIEVITATAGDDNIQADSDGGVIWLDGEEGEDTLKVGLNTPSRVTVAGGYDADEITVRATNYALVFGDYMSASAHGPAWVPGEDSASESIFDGNDTINVTVTGSDGEAIVYGQGGDDTINVFATSVGGDASVYGGSGNDTIFVDSFDIGSVEGGTGNDTITTVYSDYTTVDGGDGDDTIDVRTYITAEVLGGNGDDDITITSYDSSLTTIVGGAGDDTITLTDSLGIDTLVFGDITYNALQQPTDTQGLDHIIGYNFEAFVSGDAGPINQDVMDFGTFFANSPTDLGDPLAENHVLYAGSPFIPGSVFPLVPPTPAHNATWEHGVTVDANNVAGDSLVVLSTQGLTLTAADFSVNQLGTIQLNDNGRAVVVVGTNESSPGNGISEFDIYFVQDIDTGNGPAHQTWAVDLVASVDSLTAVGINTVYQNLDNNWL